jgi:hypothetical protein
MKKSELRKLIREVIEQTFPTGPDKPKPSQPNVSSVDANVIGTSTPLLGYDCTPIADANNYCKAIYDIPINAGVTPQFANYTDCMTSGCMQTGGPNWPDGFWDCGPENWNYDTQSCNDEWDGDVNPNMGQMMTPMAQKKIKRRRR